MKLRPLTLAAAAPAAFLAPAALPSCQPPPAPIVDLRFECRYDDGVTVFIVENRTSTGRFFVAYDRDSDWRLGTPEGDYEWYLAPYEVDSLELASEFEIDKVTIARRPPPTPGQPGFSAYDQAVAGTADCGTGD